MRTRRKWRNRQERIAVLFHPALFFERGLFRFGASNPQILI